MNPQKSKPCHLVLGGLVALLLVALGIVYTAKAYEYEESVVPSTGEDDPQDIYTETYIEDADSGSSADEDGYAQCSADSYTWATDGAGAVTGASAWGQVTYTWEWDGPPQTAPGGTLYWYHDGGGGSTVSGAVDCGNGGGALASPMATARQA